MKYFSILIILAFFFSACTNISATPTLSPTKTPISENTTMPILMSSYPQGIKWYVDTGLIHALTFDKDGYLWTGGAGVIYKWDLNNNTYKILELIGDNMPIDISAMATDKNGVIWVVAEDGIWKYADDRFVKDLNLSKYRPSLTVTQNGELIVYTRQAFYLFENESWKEYQAEHPIESISVDNKGIIWITLFEKGEGKSINWGVVTLDGKKWRTIPEFSDIEGLYKTKACDKNVWFFTQGLIDKSIPAQIIKYDGKEWTKYPQRETLLLRVVDLACDDKNSLQIYTTEGILNMENGAFVLDSYPSPVRSATSLAIAQSNNYCLGSYDGVLCQNKGIWNSYLVPGLPEWGILSLAIAPDNTIWFGTLDSGAAHFDGKSWKNYTIKDGLPSNWINDIKIDQNGSVWFGTKDGLARFDGQKWSTYTVEDGIIPSAIDAIWISNNDTMWIGGLMGVSYWDGKTWYSYPRGSFPITQTIAIDVASDGVAWFGTTDGLVKFDGKSWESYDEEDGLPYKWIDGLAVTSNGDVWISAASALTRFDGVEMQVFSREQLPLSGNYPLTLVDDCTLLVSDGVVKLHNNQPILLPWKGNKLSPHDNNSIAVAPDKSVWFATFEGALRLSDEFIPEALYTGCNN